MDKKIAGLLKKQKTLLCIEPMRKTFIDAANELSRERRIPIVLSDKTLVSGRCKFSRERVRRVRENIETKTGSLKVRIFFKSCVKSPIARYLNLLAG